MYDLKQSKNEFWISFINRDCEALKSLLYRQHNSKFMSLSLISTRIVSILGDSRSCCLLYFSKLDKYTKIPPPLLVLSLRKGSSKPSKIKLLELTSASRCVSVKHAIWIDSTKLGKNSYSLLILLVFRWTMSSEWIPSESGPGFEWISIHSNMSL